MKPEDKDLLLKDLCARLPYRVKVTFAGHSGREDCILNSQHLNSTYAIEYLGLKPYLRLISSMTEEEKMKLSLSQIYAFTHYNEIAKMDWLNAHHFDYRGLIDKGLAIEVTEDNNPY